MQWDIKFAEIISKFCQILNEAFQNGQSFLTACQSGEISPNLVTLVVNKQTSVETNSVKPTSVKSTPIKIYPRQPTLNET